MAGEKKPLQGSMEAEEDDCLCPYALVMLAEEPDAIDWFLRCMDETMRKRGPNAKRAMVVKQAFARLMNHMHTLHMRCHDLELAQAKALVYKSGGAGAN